MLVAKVYWDPLHEIFDLDLFILLILVWKYPNPHTFGVKMWKVIGGLKPECAYLLFLLEHQFDI